MATTTHNLIVGYKGHRKGTWKEKAHKLYDDLHKTESRKEILARIVKLGATIGTARSWFQTFKKEKPAKKADTAPVPKQAKKLNLSQLKKKTSLGQSLLH